MTPEQITTIVKNTHHKHEEKESIWKLLSDSYAGGERYQGKQYLHPFTQRESTTSYNERVKRAIYFNHVQPLVDLLVGFLFTAEVQRDVKQKDIIQNISLDKDINTFAQMLATNAFMYTVGVLVDSPSYDTELIKTEADRIEAGLHSYAVMYEPSKIRNWYFDKYGRLKWVLLDNTTTDNEDPSEEPNELKIYRLWTDKFFQDFQVIKKEAKKEEWEAGPKIAHPVGYVPFRFVNMSDRNNSKIADTVFEDIALISQAIYNHMSLMDEMVTGGTFKMLFYPCTGPGDLPEQLTSDGFSNFPVIPFDKESTKEPFFAGPSLDDIAPFISSIDFLVTGILRKLGLNTDQEKNYVQSGQAKFYDYKKVKSLLTSAADSMEKTEKWIFETCGSWGEPLIDESKSVIEYRKDFMGEEEEEELARLMEFYAMTTVKEIQAEITKRMTSIVLPDLSTAKQKEIEAAIDEDTESRKDMALNMPDLINQEKGDESNDNDQDKS